MKVIDFGSEEAKRLLLACMQNSKLVPVVGAGFTKGCRSKQGAVPDGNEFKSIMINSIVASCDSMKNKIETLQKRDFKGIAEIYLNDKYVSREVVKADVTKYFLNVTLPENKVNFLKSGWPYIYTFNIDDAIESHSTYKPVLPYLKLSKNVREHRCVYKVHGDASHEVMYDEMSSLIFSSSQYVRSLIKNESMIHFLKNDLLENNLIFIGCSLDKEIDLMYAVVGVDEKPNKESSRIYVTSQIPTEIDEIDLDMYKIDVVLVVNNYDNFYSDMFRIYTDSHQEIPDPFLRFKAVNVRRLDKAKDANINFLLRADASLLTNQHYTVPYYCIERDVRGGILKSIGHNPLTVVRGRRFSGKTLLLQDIAMSVKNKDVYFFPSVMTFSSEFFDQILNKKNALLIFDSNILDFDKSVIIRQRIKEINAAKTNIIIACNPSEIDVANTFVNICNDECFFELGNKFTAQEVSRINNKLSEIGIINWMEAKNLLENIFYFHKFYPDKSSNIVEAKLTDGELQAVLIVCAIDKAYSALSRALNLQHGDVVNLVQKVHPLLEIEPTLSAELHQHSKYKLIANSKSWLFQLALDYYKFNGTTKVVDVIINLIIRLIKMKEYKYVADKIIMFDNLNQIFGGGTGGAAHLILSLYEKLQPLYYMEPDYWLQRAKAILKLKKRTIKEIRDGIDYAKKAHTDGIRDKTVSNAEFTIALLYGKLCKENDYTDVNQIQEAISWFCNAISNHQHNREYVRSMLEASKGQRGYFYHLCRKLQESNLDISLLTKKEDIQILLSYMYHDHTGAA